MKILFVIPRQATTLNEKPKHPHVGVAYLSSWLAKNDISIDIFDDGIEESYEKLENKIKDDNIGLIAITMYSYGYNNGIDLINFVKNKANTPLVVGGAHVSATKKQILQETTADFAIKHEGEKTLLELFQYVSEGNHNYCDIDGLIWRNNNEIIENKDRPFLTSKELDELPLPDYYTAFDFSKYIYHQFKALPIITSRGCPYMCNYCSVKLSMGRGFRFRSPENVLSELETLYDKGIRFFDINDDCFTLDMKRANDICDRIIKSGMKIKFSLYNGIRVDRIDYDLLSKMKEAGCTFIVFGCESGNNEVLKEIKKGITTQQVFQVSKWARALKINHAVNFITGLPRETYKTALDSIDFARKLPCNFVNFYNLVPYPHTEVYEWVLNNGRFLINSNDYLKSVSIGDNVPIFETQEFTKEERLKINKMGFNMNERKILEFRFGKFIGGIIFYITRISYMHKIALKVAKLKIFYSFFLSLKSKT